MSKEKKKKELVRYITWMEYRLPSTGTQPILPVGPRPRFSRAHLGPISVALPCTSRIFYPKNLFVPGYSPGSLSIYVSDTGVADDYPSIL